MLNFPRQVLPPLPVISTLSLDSVGSLMSLNPTNPASAVFPSANRAYYYPFYVSTPILPLIMFIVNGAAVSGNFDIGIYTAAGTKLWSIGTTQQLNINTVQKVTYAGPTLGVGTFMMAVVLDNGTGTLQRGAISSVPIAQRAGIKTQNTAFPLPATATYAAPASAFVPVIGLRWDTTTI
jgi:hypothetical protein